MINCIRRSVAALSVCNAGWRGFANKATTDCRVFSGLASDASFHCGRGRILVLICAPSCGLTTGIRDYAMTLEPNTDSHLKRGTPGYRNATLALFCAGFATFALLYCVQPLLPLLAS